MKLTKEQKEQLRKEVMKEARPQVLVFEKEIEKKKNQDKTIDEIMKMVEDSKIAAQNFIYDDEERFNKRLAELKIQELDKVRKTFNAKHDTDFSLKTFKRFNGIIADFDELTTFLDEFMALVNCNNRIAISKNFNIWNEIKKAVNTSDWVKARKAVRKDIPNITLKQFMLQNKNLTVAQAKQQFEELMTSLPELTFYEFAMDKMVTILAKITDKPQELVNLMIQTKLKRDIYRIKLDIDQIAEFGNLIFNALIKD